MLGIAARYCSELSGSTALGWQPRGERHPEILIRAAPGGAFWFHRGKATRASGSRPNAVKIPRRALIPTRACGTALRARVGVGLQIVGPRFHEPPASLEPFVAPAIGVLGIVPHLVVQRRFDDFARVSGSMRKPPIVRSIVRSGELGTGRVYVSD